jgi:hypothetical protein
MTHHSTVALPGNPDMSQHFDRHFAWMKYFAYHLEPVLVPNNNQHILSPAKVRKVRYSLAELYVKSVYLNLFG